VTPRWRARVFSEVRDGRRTWTYAIFVGGRREFTDHAWPSWAQAHAAAAGVLAGLYAGDVPAAPGGPPEIPPWPFPVLLPAEAFMQHAILPPGMKIAVQLRVRDHQLEFAPRGTPADATAAWIGCGPAAAPPGPEDAPAVRAARRAYREWCQ
jgi:hypothetical protein